MADYFISGIIFWLSVSCFDQRLTEMLKKLLDCADGNGTWVYYSSDLSKAEGKDTFWFCTDHDQSVEYFKAVSDFVNKNTPLAVTYVFSLSFILIYSYLLF